MNKVSELSDDLEAVSVVLGGLKRELRTHRRFISTLLHIFHGITDFRESYKVKYNLENIICMCLLIAMRGKFTSFYNAALFIKSGRITSENSILSKITKYHLMILCEEFL